jgi:transcriptional regulator with XRE-family HTH domain
MDRKPGAIPASSHRQSVSAPPARRKAGGTAAQAPEKAQSAMELRLGKQITALRRLRGFTQDRLATATGFTKGYVSKIENSKVIPAIGTLIKIAQVLNADLADLFDDKRATAANDAISIVRAAEREPVIRGGSSFGYDYVALAHKRRRKQMEPFIMVFPSKVDRDIRFAHEGEEFIFILAGKIEFEANVDGQNQSWILSAGDSVYFDSHLPHRGRSLRGESRALVVIYRAR